MSAQTRYSFILKYILPFTDLILINLVYYISYYITSFSGKMVSGETNYHYIVVCNLIWLFCVSVFGLQNTQRLSNLEKLYRGTWRSVAAHLGLFAIYLLFSRQTDFSRTFLVFFYALLIVAFTFSRFIGTAFSYLFLSKFDLVRKVAIMGANSTADSLAIYFEEQDNVEFYGFISYGESFAVAAANGVKDIYVVIADERRNEVGALLKEADKLFLRLKFVQDLEGSMFGSCNVKYLNSKFPVITLRTEPLDDMKNRFKKRILDIVFSTMVIILIMSWLYPIVGLVIKLQSKGPILFKQMRSGRNDVPFVCYKFRSMEINNESDEKQATKDDPRVTACGRFLRRTGLDEMPQFFNVFIGDMSVVGPRPHMLIQTKQYKLIVNRYMVRHFLKPGITGWAQVNGFRGGTPELKDMQARVERDIYYLEKWTAMLDVKIVFMTIINVLRGDKNAY